MAVYLSNKAQGTLQRALQNAIAGEHIVLMPGHVERLDPVVTGHYLHATTRDLPQWNGEWKPSELAEALEPWDGVIFDNTPANAAAPDRAAMVAAAKRIQNYLYGSWDAPHDGDLEPPVAKKCTCGVQHTGGIHSDWCDLEDRGG